jgi:hypothetical protein
MTLDSDLFITCAKGCHEIRVKGGYHNCDLQDVSEAGVIAAELCHPSPWYRRRLKRILLVAALLLVTTGGTWAWMERMTDRKVTALSRVILKKAHDSYMRMDYGKSRAEVMEVLEADPSNVGALMSLKAIGDACSSGRGSNHQ